MRAGETEFVQRMGGLAVEHAEQQFLGALAGVTVPNRSATSSAKNSCACRSASSSRAAAGRALDPRSGHHLPRHHRIRGAEKAAVIKTHHNRVAGIQRSSSRAASWNR